MTAPSLSPKSFETWLAKAKALRLEGRAFINGAFVSSRSGATFQNVSPLPELSANPVARCAKEEVEIAVQAARRAFENGSWATRPLRERKKILLRLSALMHKHQEELALLETIDMGKPITDSLSEDIPSAIEHVAWFAELIDKQYDAIAPAGDAAYTALLRREPVGVVAAIVPWNYPLLMALWKVAPALSAGNSVILKPSEKSPLSVLRFAALCNEAGVPPGVFQVLPGYGSEVGEPLARHKAVDVLAFTGSTQTAKRLLVAAGESNMKRVWLEAGGKTPSLVFADAPLEEVAAASAEAIFCNQGEVCIAASRLVVLDSIHDAFVTHFKKAAAEWIPRHPLHPQSKMGPLVDRTQYERVKQYLAIGKEEGAELYSCGFSDRPELQDQCYLPPSLFLGANNQMRIAREEIFGPVATVLRVKDEAEAVQVANDTPYGLGAVVWTKDLARAHRLARQLRAGSVWVNTWGTGDATVPFGGYKQSGNGRDKSHYALEKYTELKSVIIKH